MSEFSSVGHSVRKVDSLSISTGNALYTEDYTADHQLYLHMLYSPHPHAIIREIRDEEARHLPGVVDVLHFKNVARVLYTTAGQGFPEPSPYDYCLFDNRVRYVGDRVALVAAESGEAAQKALSLIRVSYEPLPPVLDPEISTLPGAPRIHGDDAYTPLPVTYSPQTNLAAEVELGFGDLEKGFHEADLVEEHTYYSQMASHCAMEPHVSLATFDEKGRLVIITSTQVPFHVRRTVARILDIPTGMIRVIKPRIGGGFGGKQEILLEPYVAYVAWKHKRPARMVLSRKEVFTFARTRHPFRIRLKTGFKKDGTITAFDMDALMNSGAYGTHALTVLSNAGSKMLPLFNKIKNMHFHGRSVYTNLPVGGAYRGYGATQGYFAFNQQIDIIARRTGQDILEYIKKWHIREGETSEVFKVLGEGREGVGQYIRSSKLDQCIDQGAEAIGWYGTRGKNLRLNEDTFKGVGVAVSMQGSSIPLIDMAAASMKMNEDGSFNLHAGATDLGTGSDTVLSQIAAEVLTVPVGKIHIISSDTDVTPFDVGAYASSTTYLSGKAVQKCAEKVSDQILQVASLMLGSERENLILDKATVRDMSKGRSVSFQDICLHALYTEGQFQIQAQASHVSDESPPPFMAQFAEVEVDTGTGQVRISHFVSAVDCGQAINPRLAEGQVEGATVNGISYALCEDYLFDEKGRMINDSFDDYMIYTAPDIPSITTIIVDSVEETGPFGAKSVSEIGMNGPVPAIANAIFDAVGIRLFHPPFTPEKILKALEERSRGDRND